MITEDYVSFDIARLLKEKGFDDFNCHSYFYKNGDIEEETRYEGDFGRPTIQMAMKWLREVHNIAIVVTPSMFWGKYNVSIYKKGNDYPIGFDGDSLVPSYEQACEAAIKYYLENLI